MANPWDKYAAQQQTPDIPAPAPWEKYTATQASVPGMERLGGTPPGPAKVPQIQEPEGSKALTQASKSAITGPYFRAIKGAATAIGPISPNETSKGRSAADIRMGGASDVIRGGMEAAAPFVLPEAAMTAPIRTGLAIGAGAAAQYGGEKGSQALGAGPGASALVGDLAGIGAGGAVAAAPDPLKVDPRVAINRSLRPTPSDSKFAQRIPTTLARVTQANEGKIAGGITDGTLDIVSATQKAIDAHKQSFGKWMDRAKGIEVSGDSIVKATADAVSSTDLAENPAAAKAVIAEAQRAYGGKTFTVEQLDQFRQEKNAALNAFYDKATGKQSADVIAGKSAAIVKAQRDAIADAQYRALDPENEGMGPRDLKRAEGDLIDIQQAALRRQNAIIAEQPLTPLGKLIDPAKAFVRSMMPGKATGAGIAYAEGSEGRSLPLLKRALKATRDNPVPPMPEPTGLYPRGTQAGARLQLPAPNTAGRYPSEIGGDIQGGTMYTPPPADTSSVRSAPGMAQPPNPQRAIGDGRGTIVTPPPADASEINVSTGPRLQIPVNRQLPAGPSIRPPSDLSGPAGDVTDMIPIKDPVTGRIQYAPRPHPINPLGMKLMTPEAKR